MKRNVNLIWLICILLIATAICGAEGATPAYNVNDPSKLLLGMVGQYKITDNDTLLDVALHFGVGYNAVTEANKDVDPWVPTEGITITIPTQWIVPFVMDNAILINLSEMRLYYFFTSSGQRYVKTYPIGIGRAGFDSPEGVFRVTNKVANPTWRPTERMLNEDPDLETLVLPGPDNPLGDYWLQLSIPSYGIHGTNKPYSVGRRISSGCIRLYPDDIEDLFSYVKVNTPVKILREPVKTTLHEGKVYIEVHADGLSAVELMSMAVKQLSGKDLLKYVSPKLLKAATDNPTGLPTPISKE
ncbi:MAG: L,D-transpeptidase family protein [Candidatus Magnetominusculus sp. LBB02]|nr:L,D-transpeptidase family protein [Candidatus Magnetominusculus sp. LBB02]